MGDPGMTAHLGGPETPEKIRRRHARYVESSRSGVGPMFVILAGRGQIPAGSIGYWEREWQGQVVWETGWSVLPELQGQGIATRAVARLIERLRVLGERRDLHAFPGVDNAPSNAVCQKAGFALREAVDFEYPPGAFMRCNDWVFDWREGDGA